MKGASVVGVAAREGSWQTILPVVLELLLCLPPGQSTHFDVSNQW